MTRSASGRPDVLGVVDWGIGGIGLVGVLDELVPALPIIYWSDTGVVPYGKQPGGELVARLRGVTAALAARGCTRVALACNAASTVAARLGPTAVPVEGIIAHGIACVPARLRGTIGVVGGRRTIAAGAYRRGLARPDRRVVCRVAQPLSAHIEGGRLGAPELLADLRAIVAPLRGAAAVLLACTHYPAAARLFADELPGTLLCDPARRFAAAIARRGAGRSATRAAGRTFLTTGSPRAMRDAARAAWGVELGRPDAVSMY